MREKFRLAYGARTDDHLIDAGIEIALDGRDLANAAADLHRNPVRDRADRANDRGIARCTGHRPIEIDEVQPLAAFGKPVPRHRDRIGAEHGDVVHATLAKAHALAVFDVDRGNDEHGTAYSLPFVDGILWPSRGSSVSAMRNARPNALNSVSAW